MSRGLRGISIEVLPGGKNLNTAIGFYAQQIIVSRDDDLGVSLYGTLKDHIVLRIAAHSVQCSSHFDMRPVADVLRQDREDFLILPGKLPHEGGANFRDDLIADRDGVVAEHRIESGLRGAAELES